MTKRGFWRAISATNGYQTCSEFCEFVPIFDNGYKLEVSESKKGKAP